MYILHCIHQAETNNFKWQTHYTYTSIHRFQVPCKTHIAKKKNCMVLNLVLKGPFKGLYTPMHSLSTIYKASEHEGAQQSRSSTYESSVRNGFSTSKTPTMSP